MIPETDEEYAGVISRMSRPPLDVRIVARLFFTAGILAVLRGVLLCSGRIEPASSYGALLGTAVLASGLSQGVHSFIVGFYCLLCDWDLRRAVKFVWWLLMIFSAYHLIDRLVVFPIYSIAVMVVIAGYISVIVWLWFRRELYDIHLKKDAQ